jgi:hypothetical protein
MLRQRLTFRYVSYLLAAFLAVTAALKLHLLVTDPFADIKTGTSLPFLWLAVIVELTAVWLVFSKTPQVWKWLSLLVLFSLFALVAGTNVWLGKTGCGCSGAVEISPVWFLAIDLLAIGALVAARPETRHEPKHGLPIQWNGAVAGRVLGFILVGVMFVLLQTRAGRAITSQFLLGESIIAPAVEIGVMHGEPLECELKLRNQSAEARRIIGVNTSCSCVIPQEVVHTTIPPQGELAVKVHVRPKPGVPMFHQRVLFYLDSSRQYVVAADLFGTVQEN